MKIYNLEAFVICLAALAVATVMLVIERGDVAVWVGIITAVIGIYVKSPIDWGKKSDANARANDSSSVDPGTPTSDT